jgi:ABC-2 type transport system ATP-binding protein
MTPAIEAHQLTKRYRHQKANRPALDRLDLSIPPGQLYSLVGPDGAGKTTAIRILTSALSPTSGSARIAGLDIVRQAEKARPHIGYMPQVFSLYPDLSVIENLNFFADIYKVPMARRKSRIAELLEFSRLTDFQSRRSEHLSGGMRKKLALACALIHEPQVLLLDEPTTGVDPVSRRELWRLLSEVVQRGVTVLVSTPYMDEAERCNTVGILYEGRLLISGPPAALEAQLPFQVVEVKARPRGQTRDIVSSAQGVLGWRPVGDRLRLAVADPQQMQAQLASQLEQAGANVSILRQARPTMEDVFVHVAEQRQGDT